MLKNDVRRIAQDIVWQNLSAADEDAEAIVSATLTNTQYAPYGDDRMYWQPDNSHRFNDFYVVSDAQFVRIVDEVKTVSTRVAKLLTFRTTEVLDGYSEGQGLYEDASR